MTSLYISIIIGALYFLLIFGLLRILGRPRRRMRASYKTLLVRIIFCDNYTDLCHKEIEVDQFYNRWYVEDDREMVGLANNLYEAINTRAHEFIIE